MSGSQKPRPTRRPPDVTKAPAARIVGVGAETIRYYRKRNLLPFVRNADGNWVTTKEACEQMRARRIERLKSELQRAKAAGR